jgi:hypothetical protein
MPLQRIEHQATLPGVAVEPTEPWQFQHRDAADITAASYGFATERSKAPTMRRFSAMDPASPAGKRIGIQARRRIQTLRPAMQPSLFRNVLPAPHSFHRWKTRIPAIHLFRATNNDGASVNREITSH